MPTIFVKNNNVGHRSKTCLFFYKATENIKAVCVFITHCKRHQILREFVTFHKLSLKREKGV